MTEDSGELVITLDFRKLFALSLLAIITVVSVGTYIIALLAWNAPNIDLTARVISTGGTVTETLDNYGFSKSTFNQGDLFDLRVYVEAADKYWNSTAYDNLVDDFSFRVIVTIFDPNGVPMLCESYTEPYSPGDIRFYYLENDMLGSFYQIPSDAVSAANYKVRIVLWSDWLPGGIARASQAWELTFDVV